MARGLRFGAILLALWVALVATPVGTSAAAAGPAGAAAVNGYSYGYCTWWVSARRSEVGRPIPQTWGNAITWDDYARAAGYTVNHTPGVGAIMQTDAGSLGHVAFVEAVYADGGWQVSEMNWVGWNVVSHRTFAPTQTGSYDFIH